MQILRELSAPILVFPSGLSLISEQPVSNDYPKIAFYLFFTRPFQTEATQIHSSIHLHADTKKQFTKCKIDPSYYYIITYILI